MYLLHSYLYTHIYMPTPSKHNFHVHRKSPEPYQNDNKLNWTGGARPMPPTYYEPPPSIHYTTTTPRPRDLSLKLDQQHSNLRVGESTEVECYSSDNSYTDVVWERADGRPLPLHIKVSSKSIISKHPSSGFRKFKAFSHVFF